MPAVRAANLKKLLPLPATRLPPRGLTDRKTSTHRATQSRFWRQLPKEAHQPRRRSSKDHLLRAKSSSEFLSDPRPEPCGCRFHWCDESPCKKSRHTDRQSQAVLPKIRRSRTTLP